MSYQQKTVVHKEEKATGELADQHKIEAEQQAGGILDSLKETVMSGVESVRSGVNYLADQVTGQGSPTDEHHQTMTTTTVQPGPHPVVSQEKKIIEKETTYPNQQGYGVNPKFKDDADNGALADIKSGIKKGVENVKETAKEFKEDVKQGAHELKEGAKEKWEDVKIEGNRIANNPPGAPRTHTEEARRLANKGEDLLESRDKDLHEARKAKDKADKKAFEANAKVAKALHKEDLGQAYLANAGAEMQRAGAKMQAASHETGLKGETYAETVSKTPGGKKVVTETQHKIY